MTSRLLGIAPLALLLSGCLDIGLSGGAGAGATGTNDGAEGGADGSGGSGPIVTYTVNGLITENTCGSRVAPNKQFQNTADTQITGASFVFQVGNIVAHGGYAEASKIFDATTTSDVDLQALAGLTGTACQLTRIDTIDGHFLGTEPENFQGRLHIHYEPNDTALCHELLVDTFDAAFASIPCDVEYVVDGVAIN